MSVHIPRCQKDLSRTTFIKRIAHSCLAMHLTPPSHSTLPFLLLLLFLLTPHIFVFYLSLLCVYLACILFYILNIKYSLLVYVYRYRHPGMFAHGDKPLCIGACVCICVWRSAVDIGNLFECFSSFLIEKESPSYTQISMVPAILAKLLAPGISFPASHRTVYQSHSAFI